MMAKHPTHPNRTGMNEALDIVEEALAKLKENVERKSQRQHEDTETRTTGVNVQTSTTNLCQGNSDTQKDTSVLIRRRSSRHSSSSIGRRHHQSISSKTKINKRQAELSKRSGSKHSRESTSVSEASVAQGKGVTHCASRHSTKCRHRKRSSSSDDFNYESLGRRNVQGLRRNHTRKFEDEFLRGRDESPEEIRNNGNSPSWVPPLSQSSPRELSRSQSRSNSQRTLNTFHEMGVPSSSHSRVGLGPQDHNSKVPQPFKTTIPLSGQSYAEPTLTSKLRVKMSERKEKDEKENMIPFIPSGSTNKSHHVGVIMQQKLGLLKNMPLKELESITGPFNQAKLENDDGRDADSLGPTEDVIRIAMNNIQQHIAHVTKHSSKQ